MHRFINVLLFSLLSNAWLPIVNGQMVFPEPVILNGSQLSRAGFPLLPPFPIYNPYQAVVPAHLVTPPTYTSAVQTCICVPTGHCTGTTVPATPVDGSGLIDIRIVNNPTSSPTVPTAPCYHGLQRCCFPGPYRCGVRYPPVAGSPVAGPGQAQYGKYPWQAVLLGPGDVYQGSGALIDALNVLTVAHKVANYSAAPNQLRVRMGEWNAAGDTEPLPAQEFVVAKIFIHPGFNPANLINDVAILRLTVAVPLGQLPTITTACLPTSSYVGSRCWVSGWGKNDFHGVYQTIQKEVDVPILDTAKCQSSLAATRLGSAFIFNGDSFICAGGEQGKDACTGDGGSPLVCEINGQNFLAGLSAWGIGCATLNVPGVYVNINTFKTFIQSSIQSS